MKDEIYASALQHVVGLGNASLGNLFTYYESAKEAWHHVLHHNVEPSLGCKYELFDEIRRPINESFLALCQMLGYSPYESSLAPIICMVGAILFAQK